MPENKKETKKTDREPGSEASFETAMERLDQIVEQMETNKLPLEELLCGYEEGLKLVKFCSEKLDAAEKRIEMITRDAMGKPQVTEFEPAKSATTTGRPERSEDISLF